MPNFAIDLPQTVALPIVRSDEVFPECRVNCIGHPATGRLEPRVNGSVIKEAGLDQMIWKVPERIAYLSEYFGLAPAGVPGALSVKVA